MNGVWHGGGTGLTDGRRAGGPAFSGGRCPGEGPGEGTGGAGGNSLLLRQLGGTANPCIIGAEPHNPRQQGLIRTMPPIGPSKGPGEFNARLNHILPENFPGDLSQPNSAGCM